MQKKEIAVFIDQITRERAINDLLVVGQAIDEVTRKIPTVKVEEESMIAEATYVVRLDISHSYNLDAKTQGGFKVRLSGRMRGKVVLDFQVARHQSGIVVRLNDKYPYDDDTESL